jgi:hypothetical protein|tara:strand:- start:387 stop:752 length:366 start_codon:yes stop_codon:yes gene_type:complete
MAGRKNGKMKKPKMMRGGGSPMQPLQPLAPPQRPRPVRPKKPVAGKRDPMGRKMLAVGGAGKAKKGLKGGGDPLKPKAMKGGGPLKPKAKKGGGMLKGKAGKRASGPKVVSFQDYIKKMFG